MQITARTRPLLGQDTLMRAMFSGDDLSRKAEQMIKRATSDKLDAEALLDLSNILILRGDRDGGLGLLKEALQLKRFFHVQHAAEAQALRVLVLKTPGDFMANTPIEFLTKNSNISVDVLYIAPHLPIPMATPGHNLVFVAISESQPNLPMLDLAKRLCARWRIPVINQPDRIPELARDRAYQLLHGIPQLEIPNTVRLSRDALIAQTASIPDFPLIIRPLDSHAGQGLELLQQVTELDTYLAQHIADVYYVSNYIDYRSVDHQFRKYRIVFVEGAAFLCHMAISSHWMVHYLNAGMTDSAVKRAEEADMMANFEKKFVSKHQHTINSLVTRVGLDYFGIDCAETQAGELLVFEVANAMVVHDMDPEDLYPYKKENMNSVFTAFQHMLQRRQFS
ncbi:MAG: glutathione synthase/RimK-type ligase-like ATP-grasp enzyme [Candidatus Azotimanducaceae bacterium]|jgi:glutathione synthase/RimK-type ligase-like ATP-grasp enzyme